MKLTKHPGRESLNTSIYVRAADPAQGGRVVTCDISELDAESLLVWLRSRGGDNPWAEDVVGVLLGHGNLHEGE